MVLQGFEIENPIPYIFKILTSFNININLFLKTMENHFHDISFFKYVSQ